MCLKIVVFCVVRVVVATATARDGDGAEYPRSELGYPAGLFSVCPGSTKPASIPKSQLKYLRFVVQGSGAGGTRRAYSYWQARDLARDPRLDFRRKTMVVTIGYLDSPNLPIAAMFAHEYGRRGYNVILVDNQRFSTVHYHLASRLMRPVGRLVAEVLARLAPAGLAAARLELLGFSLGAHTAAFAAQHFRRLTGRNVSALTALEPSGPCFRFLPKHQRLDASDADFVQVVHTNIDGFGMAAPMGHVDFYVNGGEYQPSELTLYPCTTTCSHFRVLLLWVSAWRNPDKFIGLKCKSVQQARDADCYDNLPLHTNVMGLAVNREMRGIFYLSTTKDYPYYLGTKGLNASFAYWRTVTDVNDGNETEIYT